MHELVTLIVDDHDENVTLLTRILERAGYARLASTTDARRVAGRVKELQPDLILLDLHMPHLDGFAVMEEIRLLIPGGVPIILVTGEVDQEITQDAVVKGASDILTKPFEVQDVTDRVERQLRGPMSARVPLTGHTAARTPPGSGSTPTPRWRASRNGGAR